MDAQTASPTRRKVLFGRRPRGPQLSAFGPGYAPTAGGRGGRWQADRADQPSYRSERDPAVRDMRRTSGRGSGAPTRQCAAQRARRGAPRKRGPHGRLPERGRERLECASRAAGGFRNIGLRKQKHDHRREDRATIPRRTLFNQLLAGRAGRSAETPTVGTERARRHNEPSNVGIKRFRDGSAGPRFVLAQAPAENGLSCGTHSRPGEDASAEQNGRGEFSKPTKAPGHGRAQERYGEKRARATQERNPAEFLRRTGALRTDEMTREPPAIS